MEPALGAIDQLHPPPRATDGLALETRIGADLLVDERQAVGELSEPRGEPAPMLLEQATAVRNRAVAGAVQARIGEHALDRHTGLVHAAEELDPPHLLRAVAAVTARRSRHGVHEPDALVVAKRVRRGPGRGGDLTNRERGRHRPHPTTSSTLQVNRARKAVDGRGRVAEYPCDAMLLMREPPPALRPFVKTLWVGRDPADDAAPIGARERMLPSGAMHLVVRLSDRPIRLFTDVADRVGSDHGHAVVGGMRTGFYVRDKSPVHVVGVELKAGIDERLLGASAEELAERHTPLADLWGRAVAEMRERLSEVPTLAGQLDLFAALLARRLAPVRAMHPVVAHALSCLRDGPDVGTIVRASGYSHRRFISLFRTAALGISPKRYQRVLRFEQSLRLMIAQPARPMVDVALAAGYSDQPHFNREFREFAGDLADGIPADSHRSGPSTSRRFGVGARPSECEVDGRSPAISSSPARTRQSEHSARSAEAHGALEARGQLALLAIRRVAATSARAARGRARASREWGPGRALPVWGEGEIPRVC